MTVQKSGKLQELLSTTSIFKILVPTLLGLGVVVYIMWKNFEIQEFLKLSWNYKTIIFLSLSIIVLIVRHLAYSWRLKIISDDRFTWSKAIELIFLWEFASTVSPTSLGGSATAVIFLNQEKLSTAKSVTIILYSVVLDTLYFLLSLLLFLGIFGAPFIRPDLESVWSLNGFAYSFWIVFFFMASYGSFFFYGLFVDSDKIANILRWLSKVRFLKRYKDKLNKTALDIKEASEELKLKDRKFHLKAFTATSIAWLCKFSTIPLIIFAVVQAIEVSIFDFWFMLSRHETMFAITAFSPTPGGSGIAEALFGGFFKDYITDSASVVVAIMWRFLTYYLYLFAGVIILPNWIRKIMARRKKSKVEKDKIA